jgi:folate-binding protein YgfZ
MGAVHAPDGAPLHFGDATAEYHAAGTGVVVMDRSHEGRVRVTGADKLKVMHAISTNDLTLTAGQGRATVFTNPTARVIDRATVYGRDDDALVLIGPGRGAWFTRFLQGKIFFNDDAQPSDITPTTRQFDLHGTEADALVTTLGVALPDEGLGIVAATWADVPVWVARARSVRGGHWVVITPNDDGAAAVWAHLTEAGARPAGALAYNLLRIANGFPANGRELSEDYIPLELGLWDEVSFSKGCYTGQEIIARMESRGRIARTLVQVTLAAGVDAPAKLLHPSGGSVGTLTSSASVDAHTHIGMGVVKFDAAEVGAAFVTEGGVAVTVTGLPGAQPPSHMGRSG